VRIQEDPQENESSEGRGPIIVGGCHRSGTSLVRRILDAHSQIHCGPEVKLFMELTHPRLQGDAPHLRFVSTARVLVDGDELWDVLLRSLCEMHERAAAQAGKSRWADKNPENVIHLGWWERALGTGWTFVHVVRNPLDVIASMQDADMPYALPPTLEERIARYNKWTDTGTRFCEAHPERSHRLVYERLAVSPEEEIGALMEAVGGAFETSQLAFNDQEHAEGLEDPKVKDTDRVHADSVGQWRDRLSPRDARRIRRETWEVYRQTSPDPSWLEG
jgi:Sulfotransferase family